MAIAEATAKPTAPDQPPLYAVSAGDALQAQHVDPNRGLSTEEAVKRRQSFGPNKFAEEKKEPRWQAFLRQYGDPMQIVLLAAGIICLFIPHQLLTGILLTLLYGVGQALALVGRLSESGLLTLVFAFGPYVAFDLLFQEAITTRYALPIVIPVSYLAIRGASLMPPTPAMGLALAIDYTLLIISRFRDEIADGADRDRDPGFAILSRYQERNPKRERPEGKKACRRRGGYSFRAGAPAHPAGQWFGYDER